MPLPNDPVEMHDVPTQYPEFTTRYLKHLRQAGTVNSWRVGRRIWFSRSDIEALIEAGYRPAATSPSDGPVSNPDAPHQAAAS